MKKEYDPLALLRGIASNRKPVLCTHTLLYLAGKLAGGQAEWREGNIVVDEPETREDGEETDEDAAEYFREKQENSRAALLDRITELEEAVSEAKSLFDAARLLLRQNGFIDGNELWVSGKQGLVAVMRVFGRPGRDPYGSSEVARDWLAELLERAAADVRAGKYD